MRPLLAVLLVLLAAAPAGAAPRITRLADGPDIFTDGKRFAVELQGERVFVVDTRGGGRFTLERPGPQCVVTAIGGGHLLWECPVEGYSTSTPRIFDLAARREVRVGGRATFEELSAVETGYGMSQLSIGATWITGVSEPCYHCERFFHLNWRTGEVRNRLGGAGHVEDLDSARGYRRLCAPVRRASLPDEEQSNFDHPWLPMLAAGRWTFGAERGRNVLRRCGSRRAVVTTKSQQYALTRGHAIWLESRTLIVRPLAGGRERRFRLSPLPHKGLSMSATDDRVYVTSGGSTGPHRRWRVDL